MSSVEHRFGDCYIAAQARMSGDQPINVRGVTAVASRNGREHVALTVGRVLVYLEDHAALAALSRAVREAEDLAEQVFGPGADAFDDAERTARAHAAKTGRID